MKQTSLLQRIFVGAELSAASHSGNYQRRLALAAAILMLAFSATAFGGNPGPGGKRDIKVMTRNVYIGAELDPIVAASDPSEIPALVAQTLAKVAATDFPARSAALAEEIVSEQPDIVGLQEITSFRIQSPGDYLAGNSARASDVLMDYLQILQQQLSARGANYKVGAIVANWDVELPMVVFTDSGYRLDDLRATDYDVLLVRSDLPPGQLRLVSSDSGNYETVFEIGVAGATVSFTRGWCSVDLEIRGRRLRVINTHLESIHPLFRTGQALELVGGAANVIGDVICLGDFNSDPSFPSPEAYPVMAAAGFSDAWSIAHPDDPGYTWGQASDLLNTTSTVSERDDHVWFRGPNLSVQNIEIVGDKPSDRVISIENPANLLWPSDHSGVVTTLRLR